MAWLTRCILSLSQGSVLGQLLFTLHTADEVIGLHLLKHTPKIIADENVCILFTIRRRGLTKQNAECIDLSKGGWHPIV